MKELVEYIVRSLVDNPDEVRVQETRSEKVTILELRVAPSDVGKVIGRQGRIIKSVRAILNSVATKENKKAILEVLE